MFLASKASPTSGTLLYRSFTRGSSFIEAIGVHSSSFSSTTSTRKKVDSSSSSSSFRPRRRTPKSFHQSPKFKTRFKRAADPISINNEEVILDGTSSKDRHAIDKTFGPATGDAIRFVQRAKNRGGGDLNEDTLFPSAEETMRAADYLTADVGTTEDLVGERRAMMDAWDEEDAIQFQKDLEEYMKEEDEFSFQDLPWTEDKLENEEAGLDGKNNGRMRSSDVSDDTQQDPHQKAFGPWSETIVRVDRVQKVQRGGTMVRYRALVIGGNLNGCAGFGVAKANAPNEAADAAARIAKRNIFFIDRYMNSGLTNDLVGRHNSCKVTLRSVNPNRGLHGHPLILEILKYFGISDCSAKSHGNRNVYNVVYATFKAIMTHESLEDVALKRGKRLLTLERAKRLSI